jgi:hypothetical protein
VPASGLSIPSLMNASEIHSLHFLLWKVHAEQKAGKARVGAQIFELIVDPEVNQLGVMRFKCFGYPFERFVLFAQHGIVGCDVIGGDVPRYYPGRTLEL